MKSKHVEMFEILKVFCFAHKIDQDNKIHNWYEEIS